MLWAFYVLCDFSLSVHLQCNLLTQTGKICLWNDLLQGGTEIYNQEGTRYFTSWHI